MFKKTIYGCFMVMLMIGAVGCSGVAAPGDGAPQNDPTAPGDTGGSMDDGEGIDDGGMDDGGDDSGMDDGGDDGDTGMDTDPTPSPIDCGSRTVRDIPAPGTVTESTSFETSVTPDDTGLAKALGVLALTSECLPIGEIPAQEYTVGAAGAIEGTDRHFEVQFGCLFITSDIEHEIPDFDADPPEGLDLPEGPCEPGEIPLGRNGVGDTTGDYICVEVSSSESCLECSEETKMWTQEFSFSTTYRAKGSLDGVRVFDLCDATSEEVDIDEGDTVTVTSIVTTEYLQVD